MKILEVTSVPVSYFGGTERVVWEISKEMSKKHEVTILQTNLYDPKEMPRVANKEGVKIITCKNDSFFGGYGWSKEFKRVLKKIWNQYDIIHIHGYGRFTSDFALKFLKGKKPIIFTAHGFFHSKKHGFAKKIHNKIKGGLVKNATTCTALTELEARQYLQRGLKRDKIKIIPNGINTKRFNVKSSKDIKSKYSKKEPVLLYVGRTHESKGLKYILAAIKDLNVRFIIAGVQTPYKRELEKIISKLKIEKKVRFIKEPSEKEKINIFLASDIFILFSEWEGFGLVAIEAMAAGKPVIASDKGALPFIIANDKTGFIVRYPNVEELRSKIEFLIKNKQIKNRIGKEAKKFSKKFDWKKIIKKYESVYREAIKNA